MTTEIDIAKKLSLINDLNVDESIVNTGRVQGINIYKEKINILIAKKTDEKEDDISKIKNYIINSLSDYKDILIEVKEDDFKKVKFLICLICPNLQTRKIKSMTSGIWIVINFFGI